MSLRVEVCATEDLTFELEDEDIEDIIEEHGWLEPAAVRAKIVDVYENADSIRTGPSYDVRYDHTVLAEQYPENVNPPKG